MSGVQVASLYASIGADLSDFKRGMGVFDDSLHSAGGRLGGFTNMLGTGLVVAAGAAVAGVTVLGGVIMKTTGQAANAQQAVADIAANMHLNAEETQRVAKLVNDLGIDPKLKVTATEAAAAVDMLGKNGLSLQEIFSGAARSTVLLANSTKADFATAADIATDVMAQFKIKAEDMMTAVNGITGATQFSKFGIMDYKYALAMAGGVASSVGVNFEDFNATIAAISPLFSGGSDAGTSFKVFLQRLTPSTKPAIKAMKQLGIITADGANQFYDASGKMKSMAEIADILTRAFGGLSDEQRNQYASTLFGTDAMRAAFALMDGGGDKIRKLKEQIGNVSAEDAAATRMNTLKGDYEIFTGIIESLSIRIGEQFIPATRDMVQWLTKLATENADKIVNFFGAIAGYIPSVSDALAWLNTQWNALTILAAPAVDALSKVYENIKLVLLGFSEDNVGIFSSGIRGLMFQISEAVKNVVAYLSSIDWTSVISSWLQFIHKWGGAIWDNVYPYLRAAWGSISSWLIDPARLGELQSAVLATWNFVTEWAGKVWEFAYPRMMEAWSSLTSWVTDPAKRQQMYQAVLSAWTWITDWARNVWSNISPYLSSAWQSLSSWVTDPTKRQQMIESAKNTWTGLTTWAMGVWENIRPYLVSMAGNLKVWIDSNYPQFGSWIDAIRKFATDASAEFKAKMPEITNSLVTLRTTAETEAPKIGQAMDRLWKNLFGGAETNGQSFADSMVWLFKTVTGAIGTMISQARILLDIFNIMIEATKLAFTGDFQGYWNKRNEFNKAWEEFNNVTSQQWNTFTGGGRAGGGRVTAGGLTLVGERGPEIVDLPGGSYVHNAIDSANMMGGASRLEIVIRNEGDMPTSRAAIDQIIVALQRRLTLNGARVVLT